MGRNGNGHLLLDRDDERHYFVYKLHVVDVNIHYEPKKVLSHGR